MRAGERRSSETGVEPSRLACRPACPSSGIPAGVSMDAACRCVSRPWTRRERIASAGGYTGALNQRRVDGPEPGNDSAVGHPAHAGRATDGLPHQGPRGRPTASTSGRSGATSTPCRRPASPSRRTTRDGRKYWLLDSPAVPATRRPRALPARTGRAVLRAQGAALPRGPARSATTCRARSPRSPRSCRRGCAKNSTASQSAFAVKGDPGRHPAEPDVPATRHAPRQRRAGESARRTALLLDGQRA